MTQSKISAFVQGYLATAAALLALDAIWLTTMLPVYRGYIGDLLLDGLRVGPAIAFYLIYIFGIVVLAIMPALDHPQPWRAAALRGAVLGLVAYGTYDLTNQATLKVWPIELTLMDMTWGTILTAVAAAVGGKVVGGVSSIKV